MKNSNRIALASGLTFVIVTVILTLFLPDDFNLFLRILIGAVIGYLVGVIIEKIDKKFSKTK